MKKMITYGEPIVLPRDIPDELLGILDGLIKRGSLNLTCRIKHYVLRKVYIVNLKECSCNGVLTKALDGIYPKHM